MSTWVREWPKNLANVHLVYRHIHHDTYSEASRKQWIDKDLAPKRRAQK